MAAALDELGCPRPDWTDIAVAQKLLVLVELALQSNGELMWTRVHSASQASGHTTPSGIVERRWWAVREFWESYMALKASPAKQAEDRAFWCVRKLVSVERGFGRLKTKQVLAAFESVDGSTKGGAGKVGFAVATARLAFQAKALHLVTREKTESAFVDAVKKHGRGKGVP